VNKHKRALSNSDVSMRAARAEHHSTRGRRSISSRRFV
jgi:hypothetical protein